MAYRGKMTNYASMKSMLLFYLNINTVIDQWILVIDNWTKEVQRSIDTTNTNKGRTIQPKLDRTDQVLPYASLAM